MDQRPPEARPVLVLVATGLGLFMIFLDATIVNVALPDIQNEFDTGEQGLQWVVAAYSLTMGMFMMSAATLSDARGRLLAFLGTGARGLSALARMMLRGPGGAGRRPCYG